MENKLARAVKRWFSPPAVDAAVGVEDAAPNDGDPLRGMIPDQEDADYVGPGGSEMFRLVGQHMVQLLVAHGGLKPDEKVLEVGCGIGRIAIPLTQYLKEGMYQGFDIVPHGIEWCVKKITPLYPNFTFFLADVHNKYYHPEGRQAAAQYAFPLPDDTFDFVFLTSVFTHLMPEDMARYAHEIGRVLKPGGRVFCTAYVISAEARAHLAAGTSVKKFEPIGEYWTDAPGNPEAAIAYSQEHFEALFTSASLGTPRIVFGGWWKDPAAQDILIAGK